MLTRNMKTAFTMPPDSGLEDFKQIPNYVWLSVQTKLGKQTIEEKVRRLLWLGTGLFWAQSKGTRKTVLVSEVVRDLEDWRKRTRSIRLRLWPGSASISTADEKDEKEVFKQIKKKHFRNRVEQFPLEMLALHMQGVEELANWHIKRLQKMPSASERKTQAWYYWAAFVIALCKHHRLQIYKGERLSPGFLYLLDTLQRSIKNSSTSRVASLKLKKETLRRAALKADRLATQVGLQKLYDHLMTWNFGRVDAGSKMTLNQITKLKNTVS